MSEIELSVPPIHGLDEDCSHNLITINDDVFLYWDDFNKILNAFQLDSSNKVIKKKVINLAEKPSFSVRNLSLNWKASNLALIGPQGLSIVDLPLNWDRIFLDDQHFPTPSSCTNLGTKLFLDGSLINLQTRWHPSSDSHLFVLTNDNCLRLFDTLDSDSEKRCISVLKECRNSSPSRGLNIFNAIGEGVVSFDFGPPLIKNINCGDIPELANIFPVFCLTGDGDVYHFYFSLPEEYLSNRIFGPLLIRPKCDDDYGFDACSIMCIDHHATFLVVATLSGRIYHFLALDDPTNDGNEEQQSNLAHHNEYEFYTLKRTRICIPSISLYLTDTIKIDFLLMPNNDHQATVRRNRFLALFPHMFDPRRYFIIHSFGVHYVHISFLEQFFDHEKALKKTNTQGSIVECLLSTNFREKNVKLFPIGYGSSIKNGLNVSVMFNDGKVVFKNSTMLYMSNFIDKQASHQSTNGAPNNSSPNRFIDAAKERNKVLERVQDIIRRTTSIPNFVGSDIDKNSDLTEGDLKVLKQVIVIFKNEYFAKFLLAKSLLDSVWKEHKKSFEESTRRFELLEKRMQIICHKFPDLLKKSEIILTKKDNLNERTLKIYNKTIHKSPTIAGQDEKLIRDLREYSLKIPKFFQDIHGLENNFGLLKREMLKARLKPSKPNPAEYEKICNILKEQEKSIVELKSYFEK